MYKLIEKNNRVNYGCIDEPIEWNYEEFKLLDFFNREIRGVKKKRIKNAVTHVLFSAYSFIFFLINNGYSMSTSKTNQLF